MDKLKRYTELIEIIDYHMNKYYNEDDPEISDYEYDQLMIELKNIEKEHPEWITPDSPTQKVNVAEKRQLGVKVVQVFITPIEEDILFPLLDKEYFHVIYKIRILSNYF